MGDSMFFYDGEVLHLGNFKNILYVENNLIIVKFQKYKLIIKGESLKIIQLEEDEMYIQGIVNKLEINYEKWMYI